MPKQNAKRLVRKQILVTEEQIGKLERELSDLEEILKGEKAAVSGETQIKEQLEKARYEFESLAQQANAWEQLLTIYSEVADGLSDSDLARSYWMRLASIEEQLGKVDEAAKGYERVLALAPAGEQVAAV